MQPAQIQSEILASLSSAQAVELLWDWSFWARPTQLPPPGIWSTWIALAGRAFGKTEAGAQWVRQRVKDGAMNIALVAETSKDLEEVMVARLLAIHPEHERPTVRYKPVRITWPNGAVALGYNGTEPDQLRGPQFDTAWVDELAKYRYAREVWDMLQMTMRSGNDPRVFVTTTPRRENAPLMREILKSANTVVTRGSTFDNAANLPPKYISELRDKYAGIRLGRQELEAEILEDVVGALWSHALIDHQTPIPEMRRIVVAVDPSGASGNGDGDDIGIVVAGRGVDGRFYVLEDATCNLSPDGWARMAVGRYHHHRADCIVAERNFGGDMVQTVIRTADRLAKIKMVTASRGKSVRAEPIAALYEQGRVTHALGMEPLEDQMMQMTLQGYVGDGSPDRVDALVWALSELVEDTSSVGMFLRDKAR